MFLRHPLLRTALAACGLAALLTGRAAALPQPGQPIPHFKVVTTTGQSVTPESCRGQVVIIDFFASWCAPCRISLPHLIEMKSKYGKQGLAILGLSVDEGGEGRLGQFAREQRISYPVALAGDDVTTLFGVRSAGAVVVVDRNGKTAGVFRGYTSETGRSLEQLVKRLLAEPWREQPVAAPPGR